MFNYTCYADLPSASGDKISFEILTPVVDIPTWSTYDASAGFAVLTVWTAQRPARAAVQLPRYDRAVIVVEETIPRRIWPPK